MLQNLRISGCRLKLFPKFLQMQKFKQILLQNCRKLSKILQNLQLVSTPTHSPLIAMTDHLICLWNMRKSSTLKNWTHFVPIYSLEGGVLTNCRFYKIFDNFLHFYNKVCPNFYIYKNLKKSFNLQPDILKFYNIQSNF